MMIENLFVKKKKKKSFDQTLTRCDVVEFSIIVFSRVAKPSIPFGETTMRVRLKIYEQRFVVM